MIGESEEVTFCAECNNVLFSDANGEFCITCTSGRQKTIDKPAAPDPAVLLKPGQRMRVKASGASVTVIGHELDRGAVTYRVADAGSKESSGYLVKEMEREA